MVESTLQVDYVKKYNRVKCEDLLKRKFFYVPSFEIYGGVAGLYDYGPLGSQLKSNVEQQWRQHFVLEEDMLEVTCSNLTLDEVLKTSGHVDKFADFMVKDTKTGTCHRADKLIEEHITKVLGKKKDMKQEEKLNLLKLQDDAGSMGPAQLDETIKQLGIKAPDTNNELSEAQPFNLMFETLIGPTGQLKGYLRPETAQGIFINFRRLLEFNNGRMPFAAAQIGLGYRNEIHPKQGLLRVREFTMAEIEHFVDPTNKQHHKFNRVKDMRLPLYSSDNQIQNTRVIIRDLSLGDAVAQQVINNETLAYFMARTYQFLMSVGIKDEAIRFRQHRPDEMAHYAQDCWDAEVETSYGWIEIAGHADRSCFDLTRHSARTKTELVAARYLKEPKPIKLVKHTVNSKEVGKVFKQDSKAIKEYIDEAPEERKQQLLAEMNENNQISIKVNDKDFVLTKDHVTFEVIDKILQEEKYVPSVIEPSFGIGRIVYCIFEHCFKQRAEDAQRTYFTFPPLIAPVKCSILPLMDKPDLNRFVQDIKSMLTRAGVSSKIDDSGQTIGKRYARTDECGIPFAITVDFDTLTEESVTLRDLHTMKQVRMKITDLPSNITQLSYGIKTWDEVLQQYPLFQSGAAAE
ncbi:glycine--trna ligase [Stylonychia lemnae]|uniref:glycine--tRNA ligase n=1 Tax=Stylonychia lemnae TaxID=5949 RepID=A0A078B2L2_STYLE|nr:glycine--trna ligase [Stylonychia lemnae]|eukprot:CDW87462.1 glycine--trna ligase [Stylonychia lemnae]